MRLLELTIESTHIVEELEGQAEAHLLGRGLGMQSDHEVISVRNVHFLGDSARRELGQEGVEATHHLGPMIADIRVPLGQEA